MKTFFIFIKGYGKCPDQEFYIDAETREIAIMDFCKQHANIDPAVVEYSIEEVVEDGSENYSPEYPIGGSADAYDIQEEKNIVNDLEK